MVSLREKGVDLNDIDSRAREYERRVSLREKGVDLNIAEYQQLVIRYSLPS